MDGAATCFNPQRKIPLLSSILLLLGIHLFHGNHTSTNLTLLSDGIQYYFSSNNSTDELHSLRRQSESQRSPACHPHFQVASPPGEPLTWSSSSKFKRLYFYHARKAGGTSLSYYFEKVARHHGLEFSSMEYLGSEVPGSHDETTFYVTHLRHPVERSLSHFKCESNACPTSNFPPTFSYLSHISYNIQRQQTRNMEWNRRSPRDCLLPKKPTGMVFRLVTCAVNCYTQWFSGLSCPTWDIPIVTQAEKARDVLLRFNLIVILERLKDPAYVAAVENFMGVPGLTMTLGAWCEPESHAANRKHPLMVKNETLDHLVELNRVDIDSYNNVSSCLANGSYDFPKWDDDRFAKNESLRVPYQEFSQWKIKQALKKKKQKNS
ncbi:hypothetical protein HJC23_003708 [Cyclotella cryptica]|uniref:Sulfotransferase n=1 Tax=Cyclotella cryptica TaxID=29204 RepID=A0ABD3QUS5_9STRA